MKTSERIERIKTFQSEAYPDLVSEYEADGPLLEWLDAHPVAYRIVTGSKSKAFGRSSSHYMGGPLGKNPGPAIIISRLGAFWSELQRERWPGARTGDDFFLWAAHFTLDHYDDKGFTGGFFQQHDGEYWRWCAFLDYTPELRDEVIERFVGWCEDKTGTIFGYKTKSICIDKRAVRGPQPPTGKK
jgi:hypothetical protein